MPTAVSAVPPPASGRFPADLPRVARRLGYAGLVPFVLGALLVWFVDAPARPHVAAALSAYAAMVVAFLGAIHWGLGMMRPDPPQRLFTWSVVPALVAWIAVLMKPEAGLVVHGVMLAVCYAVDRKVYPVHGAAAWLTLRFRLSAAASLCCFVGAAGS